MKMLYCESCGDLVVPEKRGRLRWCDCHGCCCWWEDPAAGRLAVYAHGGAAACSVVGLDNALLTVPFPTFRADPTEEMGLIPGDVLAALLADSPPEYLFRRVGSLVIRIRPGHSRDTRLATWHEVRELAGRGLLA